MSGGLRFRSGQVQLVKGRVDSASVIEAGDLVFLDGDDVKSAGSFAWDTDLATTQGGFAAKFLGVAHEGSEDGKTDPISVDVSPFAIYEFDVANDTYELGELLGPDEGTSELNATQLASVGSSGLGIARAMEYTEGDRRQLRVSFCSAFQAGSANVNAAVG